MIAIFKAVPLWAWIALMAVAGISIQTYRLEVERTAYAEYVAGVEKEKADAEQQARETEQARQAAIDKVTQDANTQKAADDDRAAKLAADGDSLRQQTGKLLADRAALSTRLARTGKTVEDLTNLLAKLRNEADDYAGQLAVALTSSRRAGFACEQAYDAVRGVK